LLEFNVRRFKKLFKSNLTQYLREQAISNIITTVQGGVEIIGGLGAAFGGGAATVATSPLCLTGVGCVVPAATSTISATGMVVAAHGAGVIGNTFYNIAYNQGNDTRSGSSNHGNSLDTDKPAEGYELRDRDTGEVQKYGETTRGTKRYTKKYLEKENVQQVSVEKGTKREMHRWQHKKIVEYRKKNGVRPRLNKSDY
jgi:hypothetical protein